MPIRSHRDLDVWQMAMQLAGEIYPISMSFQAPHRHEIGGQMRSAAVSVPSNIAEGYRQRSRKVYLRHLKIAAGSAGELETQLELVCALGIASGARVEQATRTCNSVGRMLNVLISRLAADSPRD